LIVGYYESGRLCFAGKIGSGFSNAQIRDFLTRAKPLVEPAAPFTQIPIGYGSSWSYGLTRAELRTSVWLKPVLVCRVRFTAWTMGGHLRHPCFQGLREDVPPAEVVRAMPCTSL
jgi:bifunctional non-homologous end joining protein LigD